MTPAPGTSALIAAACATATSLVVLVGVWVAGGVITDNAMTAKLLTGGWFALTGAAALLLARGRGRGAAAALVCRWFVTASVAYVVPDSARVGSVVVRCRAFSVAFGTAVLAPR
jgi:hypothetical protein